MSETFPGHKQVDFKGTSGGARNKRNNSEKQTGGSFLTTLHSFFSPSAESECSSLPLLQGTRKRGTASSGGFTELESAASLQDSASLYPGKKACFQRPTLSPSSGSTNMSGSQVKNGVKPGFKPLLGASPGSNSAKPKQAKKLVIKNLKGTLCSYVHMYIRTYSTYMYICICVCVCVCVHACVRGVTLL